MRQCPKCKAWTLDFDDYFMRYRCYSPDCGWMPPSSTERELSLLSGQSELQPLCETQIEQMRIRLQACYDPRNDALVFDFGLGESFFEIPEPDGRMIWKISRHTGSVCGLSILGAVKFGVSEVQINLDARKQIIERSIQRMPAVISSGRPNRVFIENVEVTTRENIPATAYNEITEAVNQAFGKLRTFHTECCEYGTVTT